MRGDQLARQLRTIYRDLLALQPKCHAKAQSTPREIFRLLLSLLDIFLTPSHSIRKTIKGFSAISPLRLGVRKGFAGACYPWRQNPGLMGGDQISKINDLCLGPIVSALSGTRDVVAYGALLSSYNVVRKGDVAPKFPLLSPRFRGSGSVTSFMSQRSLFNKPLGNL
jgi:hypothetical protein